ncbi:hypothetical protein D3C86_1578780 [compost metagenome]
MATIGTPGQVNAVGARRLRGRSTLPISPAGRRLDGHVQIAHLLAVQIHNPQARHLLAGQAGGNAHEQVTTVRRQLEIFRRGNAANRLVAVAGGTGGSLGGKRFSRSHFSENQTSSQRTSQRSDAMDLVHEELLLLFRYPVIVKLPAAAHSTSQTKRKVLSV